MRLIKLKAIWLPFLFFCTALTAQQKTKNNLPIGVFDSGTGGLTVLEAMLTLDAFNNITGKPGADGKPDFDKEYFSTSQTRPTCLMETMLLKTKQNSCRNMW